MGVPLKIGNKLYWSAILYDTLNQNSHIEELVILELDNTYHHIACHKISSTFINPSTDLSINTPNLVYLNNRFYVACSNIWGHGNTNVIYKLDINFNKLDSLTFNTGFHLGLYNFNNKLFLSGLGYSTPSSLSSNNGAQKLEIDTLLNFSNCFQTDTYSTNGKIIPLSNTKYIYFDSKPIGSFFDSVESIVNVIYDNNNNLIKEQSFRYNTTKSEYLDVANFVDIKDGTIISVGCIGHDDSFSINDNPLPQPQKSRIFVNKLDTMGNIIWVKEYGGDMYYRTHAIVFTQDGGCLVSGLRYDKGQSYGTMFENTMESFLLKLDVNGNIQTVGFTKQQNKSASHIKCFPNPATNQLFFDIPFETELQIKITDVLGRAVLEINDYTNLEAIDVKSLNEGAYFYTIKTKGNYYSGKFFKH